MCDKKSKNQGTATDTTEDDVAVAKKRSGKRKKIFVLLFVLLNVVIIGITALIEFTGPDAGNIKDVNFTGLKWGYLALAFLMFGGVLLTETLKYGIMLKATTGKFRPALAFQVGALGKYYDNITPSGSGGQPFQVYYLSKHNVPVGPSASLPIAGFIMNQVAFVGLMIVGIIVNASRGFVSNSVFLVSAYIGILFYIMFPLLLVLFTLMPKTSGKILSFSINLGYKMRLVKHPDDAKVKVLRNVEDYRQSLVALSKTKGVLITTFALSLLLQVCVCSIPYFVLQIFGADVSYIDISFMCIYTYSAVAFVPTPGNAGAAEGTFYALFKTLNSGYIFWAMIIWRFLSYYMFIITGAGIYGFNFIKHQRISKNSKVVVVENDSENNI